MENLFYTVVIYPLTQIIELVFTFCDKLFDSTPIALIGVSFAVSMLTLPLYIVAESWQEKERLKQKEMKPKVDRIKRAFKGNEQYMILTTYYKQSHYHPIMALRSAFGLLIQIPFFTAAYTCLSSMEALKGQSFWIFKDLGVQDALFQIGSFNVNILPIIMTLINMVAAAVYLKGLPLREKIQTYGLAIIFLVLLYDRPAGLVIYWTMNQIFSLLKNIFYKIKSPLKTLYILMCSALTVLIIWMFASKALSTKRAILVSCVFSIVYFIPLILKFINYITNVFLKNIIENRKERFLIFGSSALALSLFTGLFIPTLLIASSPMEFSGIDGYGSPIFFIKNTFVQSIGLFVVWPTLIYLLYKEKVQSIITLIFSTLIIITLVNYFGFTENYGTLSTSLKFVEISSVDSSTLKILLNIFTIILSLVAILFVYKYKSFKFIKFASLLLCISLFSLSSIKSSDIKKEYNNYVDAMNSGNDVSKEMNPIFHLSKDGQNIILLYLDRGQNKFVESMFEEFPEFRQYFDGFTLYKNTVSFNSHTLMASPATFGGYEYTPMEMINRPNEYLKDKHNEAITLMPRIITEQADDYTAMITEPSWANYSWISDLSIFDKYEKISAYLTWGKYSDRWLKENITDSDTAVTSSLLKRNMLWYSLFKISPLALRPAFYNDGKYWNANDKNEDFIKYVDWYSVLDYLPELSDFNNPSKNSYISLVNESTHTSVMLQQPGYTPSPHVDNSNAPVTKNSKDESYNSMAGAMKKLCEYMKFLMENDVYNNSRIIIYSDHGCGGSNDEYNWDSKFDEIQPERYHPLLMVKDFNETGNLKLNYDFMTNADVPTLVTKDIIDEPKNPYTGKTIDSHQKQDGALICLSNKFMPYHFSSDKIFTIEKDDWVRVKDNIFDSANWVKESH